MFQTTVQNLSSCISSRKLNNPRNNGGWSNAITANGIGDPRVLSGGIGEALITTAAGLTVAIPSLIAYRYLRGKVERLVIRMEKEAMKLVDTLDERGRLARSRGAAEA